jgi:hypothetical protein
MKYFLTPHKNIPEQFLLKRKYYELDEGYHVTIESNSSGNFFIKAINGFAPPLNLRELTFTFDKLDIMECSIEKYLKLNSFW